jgi:hypothetical protein
MGTWGEAGRALLARAGGLARLHYRQMAAGDRVGARLRGRQMAPPRGSAGGPGLCASGGAACPLRRAGGRGGDATSCHRRCRGLSRRGERGRARWEPRSAQLSVRSSGAETGRAGLRRGGRGAARAPRGLRLLGRGGPGGDRGQHQELSLRPGLPLPLRVLSSPSGVERI